MDHSSKILVISIFILNVTGCANTELVRFSAIGDTPYFESDSELERLSETFEHMSTREIPFVVHVGDIFRGWTACSPDLYETRAELFSKTPMPFFITIGDNEFNDCTDPEQAQRFFREIILGSPSIQKTIKGSSEKFESIRVTRQADMIENARWSVKNVTFIMLVLPDLPGNYPLKKEKINTILNANIKFLKESFSVAKTNKHHSVILITHSEPALCRVPGCDNFNKILIDQIRGFEKPVLLINGSNHDPEFVDGGYRGIPTWWHLRPGNEPEESWPEVIFSLNTHKFMVKWHDGPSAIKE